MVGTMPASTPVTPHALLHRVHWIDTGMNPRRLSSEEFTRVFSGFYTPTCAPASVEAMAWVLQNKVVPGAVISHSTAALLRGIPLPPQLEDGVGLLSGVRYLGGGSVLTSPFIPEDGELDDRPRSTAPTRSPDQPLKLPLIHATAHPRGTYRVAHGAQLHRRELPVPATVLGRLLVSPPLEILLELATLLPVWDLVAAVDAVVGPASRTPSLSLADVRAFASNTTGRPGVAILRKAASLARERVESPGETYVRLLVTAAGFPEPTPNLPTIHPDTGQERRIDNAYEHIRLGLEYDGSWRSKSKQQWQSDEERRNELASYGWTLSRQTGQDVRQPLSFLLRLRTVFDMLGVGRAAPAVDHIRSFANSLSTADLSLQWSTRRPASTSRRLEKKTGRFRTRI